MASPPSLSSTPSLEHTLTHLLTYTHTHTQCSTRQTCFDVVKSQLCPVECFHVKHAPLVFHCHGANATYHSYLNFCPNLIVTGSPLMWLNLNHIVWHSNFSNFCSLGSGIYHMTGAFKSPIWLLKVVSWCGQGPITQFLRVLPFKLV